MALEVVTGVSHLLDADLAATMEQAPGVTVVRRCVDLAELLAAAAAGLGEVALVSADLRGLDRAALRHLAGHGLRVAGVVASGDEDAERRLRQLGVTTLLHPDDNPVDLAAALAPAALPEVVRAPDPVVPDALAWGDAHGVPAWARAEANAGSGGIPDPGLGPLGPVPGGPPPPPTLVAPAPSAERHGRITAVWGPTGAPGRTTVAVTVAAHLAQRGIQTLLVDLDTYGASVAQVLAMLDEAPGVAAACRASEQGTLDLAGLARLSPVVAPGLRVLTGLPRPERWPELRAGSLEQVLDLARGLADHVVVDCGFALEDDEELSYDTAAPRRNAATLAALEAADQVVAVGAADPIGLQRLVRAVQELAVRPVPAPLVVVTKVREAVAGPRPERAITDVLARFAGLEQPLFVPFAPAECDAALLAGRTLVEQATSAPVTQALGRVAYAIHPAWQGERPASRSRRRSRS